MENRGFLKFRQAIFDYSSNKEYPRFQKWHYWGFLPLDIEGLEGKPMIFTGPETHSQGIEHAYENSMVFLGIKSKDGVDVYEGDILKIRDPNNFGDGWHEMTVSYDGGQGFQLDSDEHGTYAFDDIMQFITAKDVKVIGNVVEGEFPKVKKVKNG